MRLPNENKRRLICDAAATLFASKPFHEVLLDDVASAAKVGKGTIYVYFKSKEDIYFSLVFEAVNELIEELHAKVSAESSTLVKLSTIVAALVEFAYKHPQLFELMRQTPAMAQGRDWRAEQKGLVGLISNIIQEGVQNGELDDPHPELTALFMPGMVRSAMLSSRELGAKVLSDQIQRLLTKGLLIRKN